jgi:hypothetical protein
MTLASLVGVPILGLMAKTLEVLYKRALALLNLSDVSRETGRGYRTLKAYRGGDRRVTHDAARELVAYLRGRGRMLNEAADKVEAALAKEEEDGQA